jgi:FkbM family methyltransferase
MLIKMKIPVLDRLVGKMITNGFRGSGLIRNAANHLCTTDEILAYTTYQSAFLLRPKDYVDRAVLRAGYYESEVLAAVVQALPQNGTFWDVGSNFGLHGITIKVMRPDVNVVCFEPSPEQAARILKHSEINCAPVTVLCLGLGDEPRLESFHILSHGNPGLSSFTPWPDIAYDRVIFSYLETADRLIASQTVPRPDLIKLDVEGGETRALAGMIGLIRSGQITRFIVEDEAARIKLATEHRFDCVQVLPGKNYVMDAPRRSLS